MAERKGKHQHRWSGWVKTALGLRKTCLDCGEERTIP